MPGAYLFGWDADAKVYRKVLVDEAGHMLTIAEGVGGTMYWSCTGVHFDIHSEYYNPALKSNTGTISTNELGSLFVANVTLPHGATVTSCKVLGNAVAQTTLWTLKRIKMSDQTLTAMASAYINTADTTISSPVIDNSLYGYYLYTGDTLNGYILYGALITYTI